MMNPGGFTADFPEDDGWGGGERPTRRGKGKPAAAAARKAFLVTRLGDYPHWDAAWIQTSIAR